jgi:cell division protein FtsW
MRRFKSGRKNRLKRFFKKGRSLDRPDYFLLGLIFLIVIFGLVMLSSASGVESFRRYNDTYYLFRHQLLNGLLPGLILFFLLSRIDYHFWERFSVLFFVVSLIFLVLVFVPGIGSNLGGPARSWIDVGGIFTFQPAEIVKLLLILSLAGWFSYRGRETNKDFWNGLVPFAVVLGLISLLIVSQPDIGTLVVIIAISLIIYFVAGASLVHILGLILAGVGGFGLLIVQAPYRAERLITFLRPEFDPQGMGYHINQALLAIGSGGWFGLGFGQSRQKFAYLPEVMGDSIFAIIAEELGFVFTTVLIILFLLLAWRSLKLARAVTDDYARLLVIGIISWFIFQAFFNIAAMIGLLPVTGIPLPFVSYGGTALVTSLAAAGILINISRQSY